MILHTLVCHHGKNGNPAELSRFIRRRLNQIRPVRDQIGGDCNELMSFSEKYGRNRQMYGEPMLADNEFISTKQKFQIATKARNSNVILPFCLGGTILSRTRANGMKIKVTLGSSRRIKDSRNAISSILHPQSGPGRGNGS